VRWKLAPLLAAFMLLFGGAPPAAEAQSAETPLESFVMQVAGLWAARDVGALIDLMPADNRLLLDTGSGTETVNSRHASAALRALFADRTSVRVRPVRVTLASSRPPRGFGELAWAFRARGAPGEQSAAVYMGAVWEGSGWKISELRIMR
jgi:hypothetical protein